MSRQKLKPYPGLRAFERDESLVFFGREQQVDELLTRLKQHHFLAVIGESGSGKSSLVRAGLLPGLEKGYMGEVGSRWSIAEMRPGNQPFVRLAEALLEDKAFRLAWNPSTTIPGNQASDGEIASLTAELRRGALSLHEILRFSPLPEGTRLLLLVDQFEEIFRFRELEENQAAAFVSLLLEACGHPDIYVVITLRSNFLGDAVEFYGLPEAINSGLYLTPRLTREQLREAICLPAQWFGGAVEDALTNHLLNEAGNDPDQLPLLQHALMRMWEGNADKTLTLAKYQGLHDLRKALDGHAEQVWEEIDKNGQVIAEAMFRALTEHSRDGQFIRRPLEVRTLLELTATDLLTLTKIVDVFRQPGCNFLMPPLNVPLTPDTTLDISHESLIRQWERLQGWVTAESEKAAMYLRLLGAAQRRASEHGELWHGKDLKLALEWRDETKPSPIWARQFGELLLPGSHPRVVGKGGGDYNLAIKFLEASEIEEQRQQQEQEHLRKRKLSQARQRNQLILIISLLAVGLAVWVVTTLNTAQIETARAIKSEKATKTATDNAKKLYRLAIAEDIHQMVIAAKDRNAISVSNFNPLMNNIRKNYDRAEELYQQAMAADPKQANRLDNFVNFIDPIRKDYDRANELYQQAIAAKRAGILANNARFELAQGNYKKGGDLIDQSFATAPERLDLKLELWFYRLTHFPQDYPQSQNEIVALLKAGVRDEGGDFSDNIAQAEKKGHPNVALLKALSDVILDKAKFETLAPYLGK